MRERKREKFVERKIEQEQSQGMRIRKRGFQGNSRRAKAGERGREGESEGDTETTIDRGERENARDLGRERREHERDDGIEWNRMH